ncbi:MAG: chemotaxis protein CheW [Veillonellales bacterium]
MATEQLVVFQLAAEEYAVSIAHVREIIRYNGATKLPDTPAYMEGMINLRGKIIPVIDLAAKFELQLEKNSDKQALIVETAGQEMGIVVDTVTEVIRLEDTAIEAANGIANSNQFIRGIGKRDDRLLIILDLSKLFNSEEMKMLRAVA